MHLKVWTRHGIKQRSRGGFAFAEAPRVVKPVGFRRRPEPGQAPEAGELVSVEEQIAMIKGDTSLQVEELDDEQARRYLAGKPEAAADVAPAFTNAMAEKDRRIAELEAELAHRPHRLDESEHRGALDDFGGGHREGEHRSGGPERLAPKPAQNPPGGHKPKGG